MNERNPRKPVENDLHCKGFLLWSSEQLIRMYWCVMNRWSNVLMWASRILNGIELSDWLREYICLSRGPPCWLSWQPLLFHSSSHAVLPGGERADIHYNWCRLRWIKRSVSSVSDWKPMAGYTGLRSCTWTEFPAHVFNSSSLLTQGSAASSCDLTLLTCLLIGSYRFCIIPLLAAFNGKDRNLWRSKLD